MGKWTLDKELADAANAGGSGFIMGSRSGSKSAEKTTSPAAEGDAVTVDKGLYRRGGYVAARASGKRMYAKGGKVEKC